MSKFRLSNRSLEHLEGVHPDLVRVVKRAIEITDVDFCVVDGLRTRKEQAQNVRKGVSRTMNSRHLTGHAVDVVPYIDGRATWEWPHIYRLAPALKQAARECGVPVEWGGDWKSFKDGAHWQLPRKSYPAIMPVDAIDHPVAEGKPDSLKKSRTVAGAGTAAAGGVASMVEPVQNAVGALQGAEASLSSGDIVRIVIGVCVVLGAAFALYARWDDWKKGAR